ncbi:MAG: RNA polymerase sigma-70 factor [Prevotellaceae bacterium]|jgi:RNA polymerase sigma-70 factor (ECF subfamily)|nr:RNA polymerase sigma-70 factor [Prevotellaceae bacterium]
MIYAEQHFSAGKIRQGDTKEFEQLFRAYYKRLCSYARNITGSAPDAEDIVCGMFVRLWEKRGQLEVHTTIESYIVSAVHHDALNYLKHAKVEERYRTKMERRLTQLGLLNPEGDDTPLSDMLEKELSEQLEKALQTLPEQCRKIFVLHNMDGLFYQKVAEDLNISINTVRTQLTRAVRKMRVALKTFDM